MSPTRSIDAVRRHASRLRRLRRVPRWDSRREPRVVWIEGQSTRAVMLAVAFAGIGARQIILHRAPQWRESVSELLPLVKACLDDVDVDLRERSYQPATLAMVLEALGVDVVVDASDRGPSDRCEVDKSVPRSLKIPAYTARACGSRLEFHLAGAGDPAELRGSGREAIETSLALAGFLTHDHASRAIVTDAERTPPPPSFSFDFARPWQSDAAPLPLTGSFPGPLSLLVVGGGGLGCPGALALGSGLPEGSRVVICDPDHIESSNRNRQFLFSIGDANDRASKAETICRRLAPLFPAVDWIACPEKFPSRRVKRLEPFDAVFSFTDSFASRLAIDRARIAPVLVNAAVDTASASAAVFHEGTASMESALNLAALTAREGVRLSCARARPSIISTNLVGAALAVSLYRRHVLHGPRPSQLFSYELSSKSRGGAWPPFPSKSASVRSKEKS